MFPTCAFDSTLQTFANPFDFQLPHSARFRGRYRAESSPKARFPRRFEALLQLPRHPLPFGSCTNPPDRSVRPVPPPEARLPKRPIVSCRGLRPASFRSTNRSVNLGTESIMNHRPRNGQTEKCRFSSLSSGFSSLIFQLFKALERWIPCAKISTSNLCSIHFVRVKRKRRISANGTPLTTCRNEPAASCVFDGPMWARERFHHSSPARSPLATDRKSVPPVENHQHGGRVANLSSAPLHYFQRFSS